MKLSLKRCIVSIIAMFLIIGCAEEYETHTLIPKYIDNYGIVDYWYDLPEGRATIAFMSIMEYAFYTDTDFGSIDISDTFTGKHSDVYNVTFHRSDPDQWIVFSFNTDAGFYKYVVFDAEFVTSDSIFNAMEQTNSDGVFRNELADMEECYSTFETLIELEQMYPNI